MRMIKVLKSSNEELFKSQKVEGSLHNEEFEKLFTIHNHLDNMNLAFACLFPIFEFGLFYFNGLAPYLIYFVMYMSTFFLTEKYQKKLKRLYKTHLSEVESYNNLRVKVNGTKT